MYRSETLRDHNLLPDQNFQTIEELVSGYRKSLINNKLKEKFIDNYIPTNRTNIVKFTAQFNNEGEIFPIYEGNCSLDVGIEDYTNEFSRNIDFYLNDKLPDRKGMIPENSNAAKADREYLESADEFKQLFLKAIGKQFDAEFGSDSPSRNMGYFNAEVNAAHILGQENYSISLEAKDASSKLQDMKFYLQPIITIRINNGLFASKAVVDNLFERTKQIIEKTYNVRDLRVTTTEGTLLS